MAAVRLAAPHVRQRRASRRASASGNPVWTSCSSSRRNRCDRHDPRRWPRPRSPWPTATVHRIFGPLAGHWRKRPVSFDFPSRAGPRNCGQSSVRTAGGADATSAPQQTVMRMQHQYVGHAWIGLLGSGHNGSVHHVDPTRTWRLPIAAALGAGRPSAAALALALGFVAAFLAHESLLVLLGLRGPRARREQGGVAVRDGAWVSARLGAHRRQRRGRLCSSPSWSGADVRPAKPSAFPGRRRTPPDRTARVPTG